MKRGDIYLVSLDPTEGRELHLQAGDTVGISVDGERLIIEAHPRPRYTPAELLAASDYSQTQPSEEREWGAQ